MFHSASILYKQFIAKTERFTFAKNWPLKLSLLLFAYVLFVAFPSFDLLKKDFAGSWAVLFQYADHPLTPHAFAPESHEAKMTFRLLVPVIIHVFHLNIAGVLVLQWLAGILSWLVFIQIVRNFTKDDTTAVILALALACIGFSRATLDIRGVFFDNVAFLFLLMPFLYPKTIVIFVSVFLAAWVDERAFIATAFILLYLIFNRAEKNSVIKIAGVVMAWLCYIGLRLYIANRYHLSTPAEGTGWAVLLAQINNWHTGIISGLEGFWILPVLFFIHKIYDRKWLDAIFLFGVMSLVIVVALSVADISRSMNYLFIAIPVTIQYLSQKENISDLRKVAAIVLLLSFLFPAYAFSGVRETYWSYPLPLQLFRMYFMP